MSSNELLKINTLEDLVAAKARMRFLITQRENDLQQRAAKLPLEVVKATAGSVIPFFLKNKAASATWHLVRGILGFVFRKKESNKETFFSSIKKWGWVTLAKAIYGMFIK